MTLEQHIEMLRSVAAVFTDEDDFNGWLSWTWGTYCYETDVEP